MPMEKTRHIMIDTETLGMEPGSVIRSVAAVEFDPYTGVTERKKLWKIDIQESMNAGFRVESGTLKWWLMQNEDARRDFVCGQEIGILEFLNQFSDFIQEKPYVFLWCLQLDFDIPMLKCYYAWRKRILKITDDSEEIPWDRRMVRDARPYYYALKCAGTLPERKHDAHSPLSDCMAQIQCIHLALKSKLNIV